MKSIYRLLAFWGKELNEVRRQPQLVLSLLAGPFIILFLFGLGYTGAPRQMSVSLVLPPEVQQQPGVDELIASITDYVDLDTTWEQVEPARAQLERGEVDLVAVLPPDAARRLARGEQIAITYLYNDLDPREIQYLRYWTYLQTEEINQALLINIFEYLQAESARSQSELAAIADDLSSLNERIPGAQAGLDTLDSLIETLDTLGSVSARLIINRPGGDLTFSTAQIRRLHDDLAALRSALESGDIAAQRAWLRSLEGELARADQALERVKQQSPRSLVRPVSSEYRNLHGAELDAMQFFAPRAIVLIVGHIAVTLAALSLVREHTRGAIEFFSVAPISMTQVLAGKYFAYLLFVGLITAGLVLVAVFLLDVPFAGSPLLLLGFGLLFILAGLGQGFVISALARSETQAVQFTMLHLLFTIFFSGFILPTYTFIEAVRDLGYLVPVTSGMPGFQEIMLRGEVPARLDWLVLGAIAAAGFGLVLLLWRREFRRLW